VFVALTLRVVSPSLTGYGPKSSRAEEAPERMRKNVCVPVETLICSQISCIMKQWYKQKGDRYGVYF
jgi:hypothetical protein